MASITKISLQKNKRRANVFLDGSFACGLELETVLKHNLKVGTNISVQELEALQAESEISKAMEYAMGICAKKFYSKHQLVEKLKQKGYLETCIQLVVNKLKEYHILDDEMFVSSYIHSQKQHSKRMLLEKLKQQGVSFDLAQKAVSEISPEVEENNARKIAEKYIKTRKEIPNIYQKSIQYVCNKGFSYDVARKVADEVFAEQGENYHETWD